MKTLAIYFSDPKIMGYPFNGPPNDNFFHGYQLLTEALSQRGVATFLVRGECYLGKGRFTNVSQIQGDQEAPVAGEIQADLIWNKDHLNSIPDIRDWPIINTMDFDRLCIDKMATVEALPQFSPKTQKIHSFAEFQAETNELIVLKKDFETGGKGVHILPAKDVTEDLYEDWSDIVVQEYLDTTIGIPGLTDKPHDLRITVVDGKPINGFLRTPPEGSLISNTARGGKPSAAPFEKVPKEAFELVEQVHNALKEYNPKIYSIDMANSPQGFKLIELNSRPGLQNPTHNPEFKKFFDAIVELLASSINA